MSSPVGGNGYFAPLTNAVSALLRGASEATSEGSPWLYLDPFATLCCLAAVEYMPRGTRLELGSYLPSVAGPGWWQSLGRSISPSGRDDLHNILSAIRKATELYEPWKEENRARGTLFEAAAKGLERLGLFYLDQEGDRNTYLLLKYFARDIRAKVQDGQHQIMSLEEIPADSRSTDCRILQRMLEDRELDQAIREAWIDATIELVLGAVHNAEETKNRDGGGHGARLILASLEQSAANAVNKAIQVAAKRARRLHDA